MKKIFYLFVFLFFTSIVSSCSNIECFITFNHPTGDYKIQNGIVVAAPGFEVVGKGCVERLWQRWCSNTAHYCKEIRRWKSTIYISSRKVVINVTCTKEEKFIGTEEDIINTIKEVSYSIYFYDDGSIKKIPYSIPIEKEYFPNLSEVLKERNYDILGDEILFEYIIPGLEYFAENNNGVYNHISDAEGELTLYKEFKEGNFSINGTVWLNVTYKEFKEETIENNESISGEIIYVKIGEDVINVSCSEVKILDNNLYCDNEKIKENVEIAIVGYYIIKTEERKLQLGYCNNCDCKVLSIINNSLYCDNNILIKNVLNSTVKYFVYVNYEDVFNMLSDKLVVEYKCESKHSARISFKGERYTFENPGLYYVSADALPKIENLPVIIVRPELVGTVHTVIYPENKREEHEIFSISASGIGNHLINISINGSYYKTFIVPEGTNITGNIVLNFEEGKMYIKYFINGQHNSTDEVISVNLTNCLHKDCSIPYEIWYDDGYGFKYYEPKLFANSTIDIKWNKLELDLKKVQIHDKNWTIVEVSAINLGPKTAGDVQLKDIKYNNSCLEISDINSTSTSIPRNESKIIATFNLRIRDYNCRPEDYNISFLAYGWNTYPTELYVFVPISYIIFPKNNSYLLSRYNINITDKNFEKCYISFDDNVYKRECNSGFMYMEYCKGGACKVNIYTENRYFIFSDTYVYITPVISKYGIAFHVVPSSIETFLGERTTMNIKVYNDNEESYTCILNFDSNILAIETISNRDFYLSGKSEEVINITLIGMKPGTGYLDIKLNCYDTNDIKINKKIPAIVKVKEGEETTTTVDEKINITSLILVAILAFLLIK